MVKVLSMRVESIEGKRRNVVANLIADTTSEVDACGASGEGVVGLTADDTMVLGSLAICVDGQVGWLNSSGQWTW